MNFVAKMFVVEREAQSLTRASRAVKESIEKRFAANMFCPQCGQQQVSGEARFCSRCGFQLEGVSGLLASGGVVAPANVAQQGVALPETPRRKGARVGGKLILFGIFLMPAMAIMHELLRIPEEAPLIGLLFFLAGLLRLIYALIFEQGPFRQPKSLAPAQFGYAPPSQLAPPMRSAAELPPAQVAPARGYAPPRADTADMAYRPSVTENTTRLLGEEDEQGNR